MSATLASSRYWAGRTLGIAIVMVFALTGTGEALGEAQSGRFCSQTASTLFSACKASVADDGLVKRAICINLSDQEERNDCFGELKTEQAEGNQLCLEQRNGRLDACKSLGEDRYDPDFEAADFDDPKNPKHPNPYFPLKVGNRWEYRGGTEIDRIEVVNETKLIDEVGCIVVRDQVFKGGALAENTDDWYAHAKDGNTWYYGEEVKNLETFDGDNPRRPELVKIDGSFKAGRKGDKPGIIFLASPHPGDVYLEEFSLGNAEDVTEVLSTTYKFGSNPDLDHLVPQKLAERLCSAGNCVVTKNFSLLEPGVFARKYYARGIGIFLEVESAGDAIQLVSCNFDARCVGLPRP